MSSALAPQRSTGDALGPHTRHFLSRLPRVGARVQTRHGAGGLGRLHDVTTKLPHLTLVWTCCCDDAMIGLRQERGANDVA